MDGWPDPCRDHDEKCQVPELSGGQGSREEGLPKCGDAGRAAGWAPAWTGLPFLDNQRKAVSVRSVCKSIVCVSESFPLLNVPGYCSHAEVPCCVCKWFCFGA